MSQRKAHFRQVFGVVLAAVFVAAGAGSVLAQADGTYKPKAKPAPKQKGTATPATGTRSTPKTTAPPPKSMREEGESIFGGRKEVPGGAPLGEAGAWTIMIEAFRGETQAEDARLGLDRVRTEGGLRDAYMERRGEATVIAYGRYGDAASKEARADLARVRSVEVMLDGTRQKPFAGAFLAPRAEIPGTLPEFDLRNARKLFGDWVIYTLQVGVYSREDLKTPTPAEMAEFRKTAEQAAAQLRREGEQAFYYHGPNRSMVTIGLFGIEDFDPQEKVESPTLRVLRKKFPYNLQNGLGIKQRVTVTDAKTGRQVKQERIQPSGLVGVPEEGK